MCFWERGKNSANGTSLLVSSAPFICLLTVADFSGKNNFLIHFFAANRERVRKLEGGHLRSLLEGVVGAKLCLRRRPAAGAAGCALCARLLGLRRRCRPQELSVQIPVLRCGVPPDSISNKANSTHLTGYSLKFFFAEAGSQTKQYRAEASESWYATSFLFCPSSISSSNFISPVH